MKTKTISNFGIIFVVALTMVTTAVFTACNSEDDFGGDITGEYTLATRMMTQRMEGGENNNIGDETYHEEPIYIPIDSQFGIEGSVSWTVYLLNNIQQAKNANLHVEKYDHSDKYTWIFVTPRKDIKGSGVQVIIDYSYSYLEEYVNEYGEKRTRTKTVTNTFSEFYETK